MTVDKEGVDFVSLSVLKPSGAAGLSYLIRKPDELPIGIQTPKVTHNNFSLYLRHTSFTQQDGISIDRVVLAELNDECIRDPLPSFLACECGRLDTKSNGDIFVFVAADDLL